MEGISIGFGRAAPSLAVRDMDRALAFYVGVLGFEKTFENGSPVGFVILKRGAAEVHLTRFPEHQAASHNVMHLLVEDAGVLHDHLVSHGATIVKAIRSADFGMRCFVLADPDGNRIDVGSNED